MTSTHIDSRPPLAGLALLRTMADNWWLVLLRGIAAIAFGILAFVWPVITLLTLTLLWGAYAVADGLFALWGAVAGPRGHMGARFWLVIVGLAGVVAGDRRDADLGRNPAAQGKRRRVALGPERSALGCLRHTSAGTAGTGRT